MASPKKTLRPARKSAASTSRQEKPPITLKALRSASRHEEPPSPVSKSSLLGESWKTIWRKPMSFAPIAYGLIGLIVIVLIIIGLAWLIFGTKAEFAPGERAGAYSFLAFGVLLIIAFLIHVSSFSISIYERIAAGITPTIKESFSLATKRYWKMGRLLGALLIVLLPLIVVALFLLATIIKLDEAGAAMTISPGEAGMLLSLGLILIAGLVFFGAWLIYVYPTMLQEETGVWKTIGKCWNLLWDDSAHVWSMLLIVAGIMVGYGIISGIVSFPFLVEDATGKMAAPWWFETINNVISAILSTWISIFVFITYRARYVSGKADE